MNANAPYAPFEVRDTLLRLKKELGTWKHVGASLSPRFNAGYLWNVAKGKKAASAKLCVALGLTPPARVIEVQAGYDVAPVCPKCGVVHTTKRCTAGQKRKPRTKAFKIEGRRYYRHEGTDQI